MVANSWYVLMAIVRIVFPFWGDQLFILEQDGSQDSKEYLKKIKNSV